MNSYQKLKQERLKLLNEIRILVGEDCMKKQQLIARYRFKFESEKQKWS